MPSPNAADDQALAALAAQLADAVDAALPRWVVRSVERVLLAWQSPGPVDPAALGAAAEAGERARVEVGGAVRELLELDVDDQRASPLAVLRRSVAYPTEVLRRAGVPPVRRDEFAERAFPEDVYDLSPATWADVDPSLHEPGLTWGAAKAHVHLARRRAEGRA